MKILKSSLIAAAIASSPAIADNVNQHSDCVDREFEVISFEIVDSHADETQELEQVAIGIDIVPHIMLSLINWLKAVF